MKNYFKDVKHYFKKLSLFFFTTLFMLIWTETINAQNIKKINSEKQKTKRYKITSANDKKNLQISIASNYIKISSIPELLDLYKGKAIFIDLWATWCHPCLEEFKYSSSLYNFLKSKDIEIIYVSIDKNKDDNNWRFKIKENNLYGKHIRANKILWDSLTTLIWGAIDVYSIPHYLLFDKNKVLKNKNPPPPSSGINLFNEIEMSLK